VAGSFEATLEILMRLRLRFLSSFSFSFSFAVEKTGFAALLSFVFSWGLGVGLRSNCDKSMVP